MSERLRIVVAGTFADVARQAGASWAVLQYVLGLRALGHDVLLVEPVAERPTLALARRFRRLVAEFDIRDRAALVLGESGTTIGAGYDDLHGDALLNLSGVLQRDELLERFPVRAYVDLDPGFNQLWHASGIDRGFARHTHHLTVGTALGTPSCKRIPMGGVRWVRTLPPVVLDHWPRVERARRGALTTIANWRSYGSIYAESGFYGQKAHSFRELIELPRLVGEPVRVALDIHPAETVDRAALAGHGWRLADPRRAAGTPAAYRRFIASSAAEIGVAKAGYVSSQCGWFSDRSAVYLASGRPVVAQDTGFKNALPTGEGLLAFATADEAAAAVQDVFGDYDRHAAAARALAEEHLDSRRVLGALLQKVAS